MEKEKATEVGCQACKKGLSGTQKGMIVFSVYILMAAVVGSIEIVKYLFSLFN
jgi:hypothetical protein